MCLAPSRGSSTSSEWLLGHARSAQPKFVEKTYVFSRVEFVRIAEVMPGTAAGGLEMRSIVWR